MSALPPPRPPFFILGCVRSGTTMLRDILRLHPNLDAPEETHYFRPSEPFGTPGYNRWVTHNTVLARHRAMDGITEEEFAGMLAAAHSRGGLYRRYMALFLSRHKPAARRWFDKTPQNVYGAALIAREFPHAGFVHIVRNPWHVISSLRIGKVVKVEEVVGACSYWREAIDIVETLKRAHPARVHEVRYEDLIRSPHEEIGRMLNFLGEPFDPADFVSYRPRMMAHDVGALFTDAERRLVPGLCGPAIDRLGYRDAAVDVVTPEAMPAGTVGSISGGG